MAVDEILQRNLDANNRRIFSLGTPTAALDATYVDTVTPPAAQGIAAPGVSLLASPADHVHPFLDELLENDPTYGVTFTPTYGSGYLNDELWAYTGSGLTLKTIHYVYTLGLLIDHYVVKVYAANGTTIIAQTTTTFSYTGSIVNSIVRTRDI